MTGRRWLAGLAVVALSATGCGGGASPPSTPASASPRPVSTEEAQVLATTLFRNYDAGSRSVRTQVAANTQNVRLDGWIDYRTHTGYALATGLGFAPQLLRWNLRQVGLRPATATATTQPPLPMPVGGWQTRAIDPTRSALDTVLGVVAGLAQDRPENPLLLQQGGALWLAREKLGDREVTEYAAPPSDKRATGPVRADDSGLRLWIDATGLMHRAQIRTGEEWAYVDFGDAAGVSLPRLPVRRR